MTARTNDGEILEQNFTTPANGLIAFEVPDIDIESDRLEIYVSHITYFFFYKLFINIQHLEIEWMLYWLILCQNFTLIVFTPGVRMWDSKEQYQLICMSI